MGCASRSGVRDIRGYAGLSEAVSPRRTSSPWVLLLSVVLLTGCGGGDPSTVDTAPVVTRSPVAIPTVATTVPPATVDESTPPSLPVTSTNDDEQDPAGSETALGITDLRVGRHEGYDRIVIDLAGKGEVGWLVRWTEDPRTQGEGAAVPLQGSASLDVFVRGLGYPMDTGVKEYDGARRRTTPGTTAVRELVYDPVYEGQAQVLLGVDKKRPFRVFRLSSPERLVVDVETG